MAGDDRDIEGTPWPKMWQNAFTSRLGLDLHGIMLRLVKHDLWPRRRWPTTASAVYVSGAAGDLGTADGQGLTEANPYGTIEAAMREAVPGRPLTIYLSPGYEYPVTERDLSARVDVTIIGQQPDSGISGSTIEVQGQSAGVPGVYSLPVDGVVEDAWRGAVVEWADGVTGVVWQNDASSGGATVFRATQNRDAAALSRAGVEASVYLPTDLAALRFAASETNPTVRGTSRLTLQRLRLRPPSDNPGVALVFSDSCTATLDTCVLLDEWQRVAVFDFGSVQLRTCFLACKHATSTFGFVTISGLGRVAYRRGCAWDGSTTTTSAGRMPFQAITNGAGGGGHNLAGGHIWREMVAANHDQEVVRFLNAYTVNTWVHLHACEGAAFTANLFRDHGRGVFCEYPDVHGTTTADYGFKARSGWVRVGRGSSLASALGTNVVACVDRDGVAYRVARDDRNGTLIQGGDLEPQWPGSVNAEVLAADRVLTWADCEYQRLDPNGVTRNVDLPGRDSGAPGREYLPLGAGSFDIYNEDGAGDLVVRWDNDGTPTTVATLTSGQSARFAVSEGAKESRIWTYGGIRRGPPGA